MTLIGVIGTGTMGTNHVRILSAMKNVQVVVSDIDKDKCKDVADTFNLNSYYFDHNEMLNNEKLDGIVIAVPSHFHRKVFFDCIKKKAHILVEKPLAETIEDARLMIEKAENNGITFTVGHVERFNPVVSMMKKMLDQIGDVYLVRTTRSGPFPKRLYGSTGGVLVDLAVHDIDVINHLIGKMDEVFAQIIKSGKQEIFANVLFKIKNVSGSSEFSWISPKRIRTIEIYGTNGMLHGDYHQQDLWFYENPDSLETKTKNLFEEILLKGNIGEGKVIKYPVKREEPLKQEIENFIDTINNKSEPFVKPKEALLALQTALSILESGKENKTIHVN